MSDRDSVSLDHRVSQVYQQARALPDFYPVADQRWSTLRNDLVGIDRERNAHAQGLRPNGTDYDALRLAAIRNALADFDRWTTSKEAAAEAANKFRLAQYPAPPIVQTFSAADTIRGFRARGVTVHSDGSSNLLATPSSKLMPGDLDTLKNNKASLVDYLHRDIAII